MKNNNVSVLDNNSSLSTVGDNNILIQNNGNVTILNIRKDTQIPLSTFNFDSSKYNLFVIENKTEQNGEFFVSKDNLPTDIKLTMDNINNLLKHPALICTKNQNYRKAGKTQKACICRVYDATPTSNGIQFKYLISVEFNQKVINENESKLGIKASEVTNEIDTPCWRIKNMNLLHITRLEDNNGKKKNAK